MKRYTLRLALIGLLILGTGAVIWALGYSTNAAVLGMILAAALTWAPTLLTLEHLARVRRLDPLGPGPWASVQELHARKLCDPRTCPVHRG
jgi:hypothetical protein